MQVILKEKIRNLGDLGETVNVKPGYARNFLLPNGKALRATTENVAVFEKQRAELEKAAAEKLTEAQTRAAKFADFSVTIASKAGEGGKLFGSIGTRDIADAVTAKGIALAKHEVRMPQGVIRQIGEYELQVQLHTDVSTTIKVIVEADTETPMTE